MVHWDKPSPEKEKTPGELLKDLQSVIRKVVDNIPRLKETLRQKSYSELYMDEPFQSFNYDYLPEDEARDLVSLGLRELIRVVSAYIASDNSRQTFGVKDAYNKLREQLSESLIQSIPEILHRFVNAIEQVEMRDKEYRP